jgi:recombinational DNA repair protein RecT
VYYALIYNRPKGQGGAKKMMYTVEKEIQWAGLGAEIKLGFDNKYGEVIIESISVKDLLNGKHKTLLSRKVKEVYKGTSENDYIFVLNSKK